jgi:cystathionine beta-lyase/cystathionine gamma-synthase
VKNPAERTRDEKNPSGPGTRAVHAGRLSDPGTGSPVTPIYQVSAFAFESLGEMVDTFEGRRDGYLYTRYGNPTLRAAEEKLAALEGAEDALLTSSGMAAASSAILATAKAGDHVVAASDLYGGTRHLLVEFLRPLGIGSSFADGTDASALERALRPETRVLLVESPANPLSRIVDFDAVVALGRRRNLRLLIDGTLGTPVNQSPLAAGFDLVLHSATKFLGGHSDLIAGAIAGSRELVARSREVVKAFGGCLDPHAAWLLERGMKTLAIRIAKENEKALAVAEFLASHPRVRRVHYPGLPGHPQHALARRQMRGFGAVLAFDMESGEAASRVMDRFRLIIRAPTLGGIETMVLQPSTSSHRAVPRPDRERAGILDGTIRVSAGIEDIDDLIADFRQALEE